MDKCIVHFHIKLPETLDVRLAPYKIVTMDSMPAYEGETTVIPKADIATVLQTAGKCLREDITVTKIPYYETSNPTGDTVYIASEV